MILYTTHWGTDLGTDLDDDLDVACGKVLLGIEHDWTGAPSPRRRSSGASTSSSGRHGEGSMPWRFRGFWRQFRDVSMIFQCLQKFANIFFWKLLIAHLLAQVGRQFWNFTQVATVRSYSDAAQRLARQSNMMKSLSQGLKVARNEDILCFLFFFRHESCTGTFSLVASRNGVCCQAPTLGLEKCHEVSYVSAFFPLLRG